jgi:DNA polymerase type B, organellar and viral
MQPHYIKKLTGKRHPKLFIAIFYSGQRWYICHWRRRDGCKERVRRCEGRSMRILWDVLRDIAKRGECWHVFTWDAYPLLCALGLYGLVRSGEASLPGVRPNTTEGQITGGKAGHWGYFICDGHPTIVDVRIQDGGKLRVVDLGNYGMQPKHFLDDGEQCTLDTVIQAVEDYSTMVHTLDMGGIRYTAASQGLCRFRTHDMHARLTPTVNQEVRQLERSAYFGGRCEAYRVGKIDGMVYHLDVTSMYSAIGLTAKFPVMCERYLDESACIQIPWLAEVANAIADVTLSSEAAYWPVRHGHRVIYPSGMYRTTLCGPELMMAIRCDAVIKVHRIAWYRMDMVWDQFAIWYLDARFSLRALGLDHLKDVLKSIGNSAYGKIGARGVQWTASEHHDRKIDWGQWYAAHPITGQVTQYRAIDGHVSYRDQSFEPENSMPAISAFHTSYGRLQLYLAMHQAGLPNVYYCDTDGIMVNRQGYDRLVARGMVADRFPGKLSVRETSSDVEIFGVKHYRFGERVCCAGIDYEAGDGGPAETVQVSHTPFGRSLRSGQPFADEKNVLKRSRRARYHQGHVDGTGRVSPWVMAPSEVDLEVSHGVCRKETVYTIVGYQRSHAPQPSPDGDSPPVQPDGSYGADQDTMPPG